MINANDLIVEQLKKGEDAEARAELCARLESTIQQSQDGQIGLADFVEDLEATLAKAKEYKNLFVD
jgi:hypothetical protein